MINCAVRRHFRFQLNLRDIEELLSERGVVVRYEMIRRWCDTRSVRILSICVSFALLRC